MQIKYNREKIEQLLKDVATLTRISVTFAGSDTNPVCSFQSTEDFCNSYKKIRENKNYCTFSDKYLLEYCSQSGKYEYHICHEGLYDAAMPIEKLGITVGYIMAGRI